MNRFIKDEESSGEEEEVILLEDDFESNITQDGIFLFIQNFLVMLNSWDLILKMMLNICQSHMKH